MEQRAIFRISDFEGINTRMSDMEIGNGASPDLLNVEFFQSGFRTRPSTALIDDGISALSAAFVGFFEGFNDLIGVTADGKAYTFSLGTKAWVEQVTGLTAAAYVNYPVFASYNALDMMVNGSGNDNPQVWDGATWTTLGGSPPKADDITVWRNHVFLTGLASPYQGEVRFSEMELPEQWPSGSFLRPTKREYGSDLVCSRPCPFPGEEDGTRLVVFAKDRIYHFDGFNKALFQIYMVRHGIGCIAKRSVVTTDNYVFWLDRGGIMCSPDGGYTINNISWNIQPKIDELLSSGYGVYCCAVHNRWKRQVWFSFQSASGAYHDTILVYNYGLSTPMTPAETEGARHVWSIYDISSPAMAEVERPFEGIIGGEGTDSSALIGVALNLDPRADQYRYSGFAAYSSGRDVGWRFKSKRFSLGDSASVEGILRKLNIIHKVSANGSATVEMYKNYSNTPDQSDTLNLYGDGDLLDTEFTLDSSRLAEGSSIATQVWYNKRMSAVQVKLSGTIYYSNVDSVAVDDIEGVPGSIQDPAVVHEIYEASLELNQKRGTR